MTTTRKVAGVDVSRPEKVLFPEGGITKADLAEYYAAVADHMLPHLSGRPLTMQRFPDGIGRQGFYEKRRSDHFPEWVGSITVETGDGPQEQVLVESRRALVYLADQGCVTPHVWLARSAASRSGRAASAAAGLDHPDQMMFDIDPSVEDLVLVRRATRAVRDVLASLGLTAYVKTTGSRGYHVVVPIRAEMHADDVRGVARAVARRVVEEDPHSFTVEQRKDRRRGRVFVDVMRNGYGQTAVSPYAVRARPGAPVATPIRWDELSRVEPDHFTISSLPRRLGQGVDPWSGLARHAQRLTRVARDLGVERDSEDG